MITLDTWVGFTIATVISAVIIYAPLSENRKMKAEAVKRGAAEWVVDPANGETTFQWKEVTP